MQMLMEANDFRDRLVGEIRADQLHRDWRRRKFSAVLLEAGRG